MLFLRFFIKSYLKRPAAGKVESQGRRFSKSGYEAVKEVEKEVVKAARRDRGSALNTPAHSDAEASSPATGSFKNKNKLSMTKIKDEVNEKAAEANDLVSKGVNGVKNAAEKVQNNETAENAKELASKAAESAKESASKAAEITKETASHLEAKAEKGANNVVAELKQASEDKIGDKEESSDAAKFPLKEKKKNKSKNKDDNQGQQEVTTNGEEHSYAEAAAKPPAEPENDVVQAGGEKTVVDDEDKSETVPDTEPEHEASIDEITNDEEKKAEDEMQPEALSRS